MTIPPEVAEFRAHHRAHHIGPRYRGWLHFATTTLGALVAIGFAIAMVDAPSWGELATVPAAFFIANFGEYLVHRGPMHRRRHGLTVLYERHTRQHHRFYTHEAMAAESSRDFQMVLFPPVMLAFFLGGLALPLGAIMYALFTPNVGWLFGATAIAYFLTYEWLHLAYHLPEGSWIGRRWLVQRLRLHHMRHHDPRRMSSENFNITFPIADWVLGTMARSTAPGSRFDPRPVDPPGD